MSFAAFSRAAGYEPDTVGRAMRRQFDLLGIGRYIGELRERRGEVCAVVKPNLLLARDPERFTTTHPAVAAAAARELLRCGATRVVIADSPGGPYTAGALSAIYRACGMERAAEEAGASLNFDTSWEPVRCAGFARCASFNVIAPIARADLVLNLPKLKTHGMTTLSCAVKNLFGCVPGLQKPELHCRFPDPRDFAEMLVDLARAVAPAFTIVDAVVSMEGDGPSGGTARRTGFLAGGGDPFALDAVLAGLTGLADVATVEVSRARGLVPEEIARVGGTPALRRPFTPPRTKSPSFLESVPRPVRPAAERLIDRFAKPAPRVDARRCVGCGKCDESCPAKVIKVEKGRAVIDPAGCIRCFCCHEMCPVGAVKIRRMGVFDL